MTYFTIVYILLIYLNDMCSGSGINGIQKDYCSWEEFNPTCNNGEVIFIQNAKYGLMEMGSCAKDDTGFIGCSTDVHGFLDSKCSGKRNCMVRVADKEIKDQLQEICPEPYLKAAYTCQKVFTITERECSTIKVRQGTSYIASIVSAETSCGYGNNPWILKAQSGQQINLTLMDFAWQNRNAWRQNCQSVYGHVLDMNNEVKDICGNSKRESHIITSSTHEVHIVLKEVHNSEFVIKYEAIGCPDIIPPANAWLRKDENDITVGCQTSTDKWQLKCVGNHWIGIIGNCTQATIPVKEPLKKKQEFGGNHVVSFAIGCAAIVICCITVTIGIYFVKRYKIKIKSKHEVPSDHEMYLVPQQSTSNTIMLQQTLPSSHKQNGVRNEQQFYPATNTMNVHGHGQNNDAESVKYYVLERPPGYINENQPS